MLEELKKVENVLILSVLVLLRPNVPNNKEQQLKLAVIVNDN
jgi:hypothetical protein